VHLFWENLDNAFDFWLPRPVRLTYSCRVFVPRNRLLIVIINDGHGHPVFKFPSNMIRQAFCMFEFVLFRSAGSLIHNRNVSKVRVAMGRELARLHPVEADIVVPGPRSGVYAALGLARAGDPVLAGFVFAITTSLELLNNLPRLIRDFDVASGNSI